MVRGPFPGGPLPRTGVPHPWQGGTPGWYPQPGQDGGTPGQGWDIPRNRTSEGVLDTRRAVCLFRSRRRTFLLISNKKLKLPCHVNLITVFNRFYFHHYRFRSFLQVQQKYQSRHRPRGGGMGQPKTPCFQAPKLTILRFLFIFCLCFYLHALSILFL